MIKAIIFDFDGTIIDTETLWYKVYKEVLDKEYNIDLPLSVFAKVIGTTDEVLYSYIESETKAIVNREELENMVHDRFQGLKHTLSLRDGVLELIRESSEKGLKVAIASSSKRKWIVDFLDLFQIGEYFSIIKSKEDVVKVKPDPALYIKAVEELGVEPEEALAIEDSVNGSIAAIEAGLTAVVVPNEVTSFLDFNKRALVYQSFSDINLDNLLNR